MDLVQARNLGEAWKLADRVAREYPCHVSYQARASTAQLMGRHRLALSDFRQAYKLVPEPYDLEGIARSAIATGDLEMAAKVCRALKAFPYRSEPERRRGMRCVQAIAAAAAVLTEREQDGARLVRHTEDAEEGE
jgi:hypothetical protein